MFGIPAFLLKLAVWLLVFTVRVVLGTVRAVQRFLAQDPARRDLGALGRDVVKVIEDAIENFRELDRTTPPPIPAPPRRPAPTASSARPTQPAPRPSPARPAASTAIKTAATRRVPSVHEARQLLADTTGSTAVLSAGPVLCGRELLLQAYAHRHQPSRARAMVDAAVVLFEDGTRRPSVGSGMTAEYQDRDQAVGDALMWNGIALALAADRAAAITTLRRAVAAWSTAPEHTQLTLAPQGDLVALVPSSHAALKMGRSAEELAELLLATGAPEANQWFDQAAITYERAGRSDRADAVRRRLRLGHHHLASDGFLSRTPNPDATTVLGTTTARELIDVCNKAAV